MITFTQKELAEKLQEEGNFNHDTSEVVLLEDTVWGLAKGVYRPLGELRIPLQYFNGDYMRDSGLNCVIYELLTVLNHTFFEGIIPRKENGLPLYVDDHTDTLRNSGDQWIYSRGSSDGRSARKVVETFVAEFLNRYQNRKSETEETQECLQRGFIKYTPLKTTGE